MVDSGSALVMVWVTKAGPGAKVPAGQDAAPWTRGQVTREREAVGWGCSNMDGPVTGSGRASGTTWCPGLALPALASSGSALPEQREAEKGQCPLRTVWHLPVGFECGEGAAS